MRKLVLGLVLVLGLMVALPTAASAGGTYVLNCSESGACALVIAEGGDGEGFAYVQTSNQSGNVLVVHETLATSYIGAEAESCIFDETTGQFDCHGGGS